MFISEVQQAVGRKEAMKGGGAFYRTCSCSHVTTMLWTSCWLFQSGWGLLGLSRLSSALLSSLEPGVALRLHRLGSAACSIAVIRYCQETAQP